MASPSFVDVSWGLQNSSSATSITTSAPSFSAGNLLLYAVYVAAAEIGPATPSGFTLLWNRPSPYAAGQGPYEMVSVFWKIATSSDVSNLTSITSSYNYLSVGASRAVSFWASFSGCDQTTPIQNYKVAVGNASGASPGSYSHFEMNNGDDILVVSMLATEGKNLGSQSITGGPDSFTTVWTEFSDGTDTYEETTGGGSPAGHCGITAQYVAHTTSGAQMSSGTWQNFGNTDWTTSSILLQEPQSGGSTSFQGKLGDLTVSKMYLGDTEVTGGYLGDIDLWA